MSNRRCIPQEIKSVAQREGNSYKCYWQKDNCKLSLHSYVVNTKSSGKKNVLALSSMPFIFGTTKDDGKDKPALLKFYDFTKGGTDVVDQRIGNYSVNSLSKRWPMTAFAYILDTARINSQTMFAINHDLSPRQQNSFLFGWELAKQLITPHLRERKLISGLQTSTLNKINMFLNESEQIVPTTSHLLPVKSEQKRRCVECVNDLKGDGYTEKRNKLAKTNAQCQKCGNPLCPTKHLIRICCKCA